MQLRSASAEQSGGSEGKRDRGKDGTKVGVGAGCCELCVRLEDIIMLISDHYLNEVDGTTGVLLIGDRKKFCSLLLVTNNSPDVPQHTHTHNIMQKHN